MDLHGKIMNLPVDLARMPSDMDEAQVCLYLGGHRDARHAAAELASEAAAELAELRRDAARYRFLRDVSTVTWRSFQEQWRMPAAKCDAAIDAAMTGETR